MKRITVSLPDDLAEAVARAVESGYARNVSAYVADALHVHGRSESLDRILADWNAETPVPDEVARRIDSELDDVGMIDHSGRSGRLAG